MRGVCFTVFLIMVLACGSSVYAIPLLSNDAGAHLVPGDSLYAHYEYGEELQRNKIERELELETREARPEITREIVEQEISGSGPRVSFMSTDTKKVALPFGSANVFSYSHQLPPAVSPDVLGSPKFNDMNFTTNLIEFGLELEGMRSSSSGSFEVRLAQGGVDLASLGALAFHNNKFEFEFEQQARFLGGTGIAPEIYAAIADGMVDVRIVRTSGTAKLYLTASELELEKPAAAPVPEPSTWLSLGSGLAGLLLWRRKQAA